jgi:hypothetical protein
MSYVTLEVEIDHGRIKAIEPEKLPERGKGLLTVTECSQELATPDPLEAFRELKRSLNLDDAKAKAWLEMIQDARR